MRNPSPIRVWNWLAAAGLLFCLASFAEAQTTPKVWKDPASGHSLTATQAAGPDLHQVGEDEDFLQKRHDWFYGQRAYPLGFIPPNARLNALKEMDAMIEEEIKRGLRPPQGAVAPQQGGAEPRIGFPFSSTGTSIGPTPENNTSGNIFFGSPTDSGRVSAIAVDPTNSSIVYVGGANGGIWKSTDSGANWTPLTDTQPSLAIGSIAIAPSNASIIYVGTGEQDFLGNTPTVGNENYYGVGVLKSTDGGATWANLTGPFAGPLSNTVGGARIPAIAVHPTNPSIVLVGALFTSRSGGASGIYRSIDGGATWTQVVSGPTGNSVVFDPTNGNLAYAGLSDLVSGAANGVYKSTDAGATFTKLAGGLPTSGVGRIELAIARSSPATVYASIADGASGSGPLLGLFKTTDGGATWTKVTDGTVFDYCGGQCFYSHAITVSPLDANTVIAGGTAGLGAGVPAVGQTLFRSTNGGVTFTDIHTGASGTRLHADQHAIVFSVDGTKLYDGNDGGVWRTDNPTAAPGTLDWVNLNGTLTLAEFYPGFAVDENNANRAVGGTQDNGTIAFSGNALWDQIACGDGAANLIDRKVPSTVYIMCTSGNSPYIQRSLTGGGVGTFVPIQTGINTGQPREFIPYITMDHSSTNILYTPTSLVYRSMDWGTNWTPISPVLAANGSPIAVIAVADSNSNVVYAATDDGRVWRTTSALIPDPTSTWTNLNTAALPTRFFTSIATDGSDPTGNTAYLGASGFTFGADTKGHVFKTTDGGATWTDISGNLPNTPVNAIVTGNTAGTLFVGTDIGVFMTTNNGGLWTTFATGLPRVAVLSLAGTNAVGFAATHGRGVWAVDILGTPPAGPVLTSISPSFKAGGSASFTLTADGTQFTMNSRIQWEGSQTGVSNQVFVSANQLTATIDTSLLTPGVHGVTVFDPSGVSRQLNFAVTGTAPTLSSINPMITNPGGPAFPLTAMGTGFTCGGTTPTLVDFGGDLLTPSTCSATSMQVTVPASDITTTRSVLVRAFTTPPGGGPSGALNFVVGTPPANDNFVNAITASPTPFTDMKDTTLATTESTDPFPPVSCVGSSGPGRANTVWYYFIAPSNGTINADTLTSNYDTVLTAITGSAPGSIVTCNDDGGGPGGPSIISFAATSGVRYSFMVGGFGPPSTSSGLAVFHLTFTPTGGGPDLSIVKTHSGNFTVGTNGVYTITVSNIGTGPTTGAITVTDTLPAGLGFVSGTGTNWTCSAVAQVVTCTNAGPIANGANSVITLTVTVGTAASPAVTNTATVSDPGDTNPTGADKSSSNPTTVTAPDLSMAKSHTGSFTVGVNGVYTLTVSNVGTAPTSGTITVTDTLPNGLGFVSGAGTGWTCSAVAQVVTCTNAGPIANGANSVITLTVTVSAAAVPSVTNTASVSTPNDPNASNNSASDPTTVNAAPTPDLAMAKSHTGNFTVGVNGVYTLTVSNVGTVPTSGTITVSDTLPNGLGFVSGTGTNWTCSAVAQAVTCTNAGPIANGANSVITLTVTVGAPAVPSVTNTASVSTPNDPNASNNSFSDPTTVNAAPAPDVAITKSHSGNFTVGVNGTYTIKVKNNGTAATTGTVTVSDTLPNGLGFVSGTGTAWTCNAAGQAVTCTNPGPLGIGQSAGDITLVVSVGAAAAANSPVTQTAMVSDPGDGNPTGADKSSSDPTIVMSIDVGITKSHAGNFTVGTNGVYTLTVRNNGNSPTTGLITVSDTLPAGLTFVSGTGTGWACNAAAQVVTCTNAGPIAGGVSSVITLTVGVSGVALPSVTNTATLSDPGDTNPAGADKSSSDPTTVVTVDVGITKSHAGNFTVGTNGVYTLTVKNNGSGATTGTVTVSDTLPNGLTFVSGTGTGWNCNAAGQVVTCTNPGPIASGASSVITLTVSVGAAAAPGVTNTATVSDPGDSNPAGADKSSSDPTTVLTIDVGITKSHVGSFVALGANGVYTLTVKNNGSAATTGTITVSDTLPAGLTFVSGTGTGWNCNAAGQAVTCTNAGPIASGASSVITLTVSVSGVAVPSVTNTATVTDPGDSNPAGADKTSSNPTAVDNPAPMLTSILPTAGNVGQAITMTLTGTGFITGQSTVNFGAMAITGGTASNGGTTLTVSISGTTLGAVGTVQVKVTNATPGGGQSPGAGQTFTISDFTVSSPTGEQTKPAGTPAMFEIDVATQGGNLANDVTFSATGLPPASTGTFNPASFLKGSTGGMSTLTIATTKRMAVPPLQSPRPPRPNPLLWLLAAVLAMMSYSLLRRGLRTRRLALYLPLALLLLSAAFVAGCAGPAGTPAGTYNVTVTATSGGVTHSTQVKITVP